MDVMEGKDKEDYPPSIFEKTNPSLNSARDLTFELRGNVFTCKERLANAHNAHNWRCYGGVIPSSAKFSLFLV